MVVQARNTSATRTYFQGRRQREVRANVVKPRYDGAVYDYF
jgi:hypothetical protein